MFQFAGRTYSWSARFTKYVPSVLEPKPSADVSLKHCCHSKRYRQLLVITQNYFRRIWQGLPDLWTAVSGNS